MYCHEYAILVNDQSSINFKMDLVKTNSPSGQTLQLKKSGCDFVIRNKFQNLLGGLTISDSLIGSLQETCSIKPS